METGEQSLCLLCDNITVNYTVLNACCKILRSLHIPLLLSPVRLLGQIRGGGFLTRLKKTYCRVVILRQRI